MSEDSRQPSKLRRGKRATWRQWLLIGLPVVVVLWGAFGFAPWMLSAKETASNFGDSFGFVNSFFSAIALLGVIMAIVLQSQELELQRKELRMTRREMQQSRIAQQASERALSEQVKYLRDQHDTRIYIFIASVFRDDELRKARKRVYEHRETPGEDPEKEWDARDTWMARSVAGSFEIAWTATLKSEWARQRVIEDWGQQIWKCWTAIEKQLDLWRRAENAPNLFESFRQLANEVSAEKRRSADRPQSNS